MIKSHGYAAPGPKAPLEPFNFERREPGAHDVVINITFCGVCHSDIHQAQDDWGGSTFPMVPGHEIVGTVARVGAEVNKFEVGDLVGVGCLVDSCRTCVNCKDGFEQFCLKGFTGTYNSTERESGAPTQGGYANNIVVSHDFVLKIDSTLDAARVAPLLCAGITTYSPLKHWNIGPGKKVGIVGLGGLGHMGVKFARSFGAHVTVLTTSEGKRADALKLGAHAVVISKDEKAMAACAGQLDFILNTVAAKQDLDAFLNLLKRDGTMVIVGAPEKPHELSAFSLIFGRRSLAGSLIGGLPETQEMLDYCAKHNILSDIELIPVQKINESYERMLKSDVKYRFVIDMKSLK